MGEPEKPETVTVANLVEGGITLFEFAATRTVKSWRETDRETTRKALLEDADVQASFLNDDQLMSTLQAAGYPGTGKIPPVLPQDRRLKSPDAIADDADPIGQSQDRADSMGSPTDADLGSLTDGAKNTFQGGLRNGQDYGRGYGWTTRRPAPGVALAAVLVLLLGNACGGAGKPSPRVAGDRLTAWMTSLGQTLARGVQPLQPWTPTDDGTTEDTGGCGDGTVRRSYAATLDVPDNGQPDAGDRAELLAGQLGQAGWEPSMPETEQTSGSFTALRTKEDSTRTKLALEYSSLPGGWHYEVTAKTACLPTS